MKFPRLGRTGCLAILATVVFVIFVLGLGIGYGVKGSQGKGTSSGNPFQGASSIAQVISLWTRASTALFTWIMNHDLSEIVKDETSVRKTQQWLFLKAISDNKKVDFSTIALFCLQIPI